MINDKAIEYCECMSHDNPNELTIMVNLQYDYTTIDAEFIMQHVDKQSDILDLACGTGLTINKYYDRVGHIDAVEMFPEFSQFIVKTPKVTVHNEDIMEFSTDKSYDLILMFGIVQYFNSEEVTYLYDKYKDNLKSSGKLLIKNQFGIKDDVEVSGFSTEIKKEYHSQYRHIDKEVEILKSIGYSVVKIVDIYPVNANRWNNTHFYAIEANSISDSYQESEQRK